MLGLWWNWKDYQTKTLLTTVNGGASKSPPFFCLSNKLFLPQKIVEQIIHCHLVLHEGGTFVFEQSVGNNPSGDDATLSLCGVAESIF